MWKSSAEAEVGLWKPLMPTWLVNCGLASSRNVTYVTYSGKKREDLF